MRSPITVMVLLAMACGGEKKPNEATPAPAPSAASADAVAPRAEAMSSPMCDQLTAADPKVQAARRAACWYTCEAWPGWQQLNRGACPKSVDELTALRRLPNAVDPWGRPYQMACGDQLPAGAKTVCDGQLVPGPAFAVVSVGPDGKEGTDDDVRSWDQ
jgi:hypothetical protein